MGFRNMLEKLEKNIFFQFQALIVDASHDSHYGPNLPSKVEAPLLSADAIDLLVNCLTSKESELWHSLGESWYVALEDWKSYVHPYKPVFLNGYTPSVIYPENGDKINPGIGSRSSQ